MQGRAMVLSLTVLTCILIAGRPALAATPVKKTTTTTEAATYPWHDKMARGVVNAVTSPVEIVRGIDLTSKSDGVLKGWTIGFVKGLAGGLIRLGAGVVDFVTCPFNFPDKNKAPIVHPTYVWQDWSGEYMK